jgi:hypothetical protein
VVLLVLASSHGSSNESGRAGQPHTSGHAADITGEAWPQLAELVAVALAEWEDGGWRGAGG